MAKTGMALGMPTDFSTIPATCEHCILGKQAKAAVPWTRGGLRSEGLLDKVFLDIMGPEDVPAGGKSYALNLVDDASRQTWLYFLAKKSDAITVFQEWQALVERESGRKVGILNTDNGSEYTSKEYESYLCREGITHHTTAPNTSVENGVSERSHHTIMSHARAIHLDAKLPPNLWAECAQAACYLKNRTPTRALDKKTLHELWTGRKPNLTHLRELGCRASVLIQNHHNPKIYEWSIECVLVGYSLNSKTYRCYDQKTGKIIISRNVKFIEHKDSVPRPLKPGVIINDDGPSSDDDSSSEDKLADERGLPESTARSSSQPTIPNNAESTDPNDVEPTIPDDVNTLRRSKRKVQPSVAGAVLRGLQIESKTDRAVRDAKEASVRIRTAKAARRKAAIEASLAHDHLLGIVYEDKDPLSHREAMGHSDADDWQKGIETELKSIAKHKVWTELPRSDIPQGKKAIKSKFVFHLKHDEQ